MSIRSDDAIARPSVLFVCVKNGGKSQMAAGLMRNLVGDTVDVRSAVTKPGSAINGLFRNRSSRWVSTSPPRSHGPSLRT